MTKTRGVVAAGHPATVEAAAEVLAAGGNAFDAALAAFFAACVAEPVLASLGGGGFLLGSSPDAPPLLYDFFVQTPRRKPQEEALDFYPIVADFGTTQQEFHIGMGSIATPGAVKGIFAIHRDLCSLPLDAIIQPACAAARNGIEVNSFQAYIADIVSPILLSSDEALRLHESTVAPGRLAREQETILHRDQADIFELLATEDERVFYEGELGRELVRACRERGGCLGPDDLAEYEVVKRTPLPLKYHGCNLFTNPVPSLGGSLIAFALSLLQQESLGRLEPGSGPHLMKLASAMRLTQHLRKAEGVDTRLDESVSRKILGDEYLEAYRTSLREHHPFPRGTTQISVADAKGNMASMTLSNGEGAGYVIPGTGIMLNNMLGEEDINPHGFHRWPEDRRIASMMSPTLVFAHDGRRIVTGSGGSNRIRSAILQVLVNLIDFGMSVDDAVEAPRIHFESDLLNLEHPRETQIETMLRTSFDELRFWPDKNLFFGGAHSVVLAADATLSGKGDSRRGGASKVV